MTLEDLTDSLKDLTRQSIIQQYYVNERIRSEGQSGIKQVGQ